MNISDFTLNENQRIAVEWTEGPLLVLAGPGSGKTLVLTLRAARLLQTDPEASVLALTFTTKAADEMRERLDKLMGGRASRAHLCTFHSFAGDILRQHGSHVGVKPDFSLLTLDEDRLALVEILLAETPKLPMNGDAPYSERLQTIYKMLLPHVSSIPTDRENVMILLNQLFAESCIDTPVNARIADTPLWIPLLFEAYCLILQEHNRLDYGALLFFARKLLSKNPGVARLMRLAWQYVCVDEFQDTNRAQYDILRPLISEDRPNLFVVADEDQIIYQWNGANPERLFALRDDYKMQVLQLPENFRCPPIIVQLANNLICHNHIRLEDKNPLIACKHAAETDTVKVNIYSDEDEETTAISKVIQEQNWNPEECAVLARTTKLLQKVAQSLDSNGFVPYIAQRKNEFESASIRWVHSILRLANARHDREFLRRLCIAWQNFTDIPIELKDVEVAAALNGGDFLRAWVGIVYKKVDSKEIRDLLSRVEKELLERLEFIKLIEWFLEQKWLDDPLEVEEKQIWLELHETLLREHTPENVTLHLYLQEMDLKSKLSVRQPGSIPCLTVHGAKGLEFKHVFLIGMADEVFPSFQAVKKGSDSKEMEEERRNCFVAITRVQNTLHISWARRYNGFNKRPSRFIEEMGFTIKKS